MGEQGLPGADGEARQVLVQVVGVFLPDGAVGHGPGRAVRVVGVGYQLIAIYSAHTQNKLVTYWFTSFSRIRNLNSLPDLSFSSSLMGIKMFPCNIT